MIKDHSAISKEEQDEVRQYVNNHPLVRPDTTYLKIVRCVILFLICVLIIGSFVSVILYATKVFEKTSEAIATPLFIFLIYLAVLMLLLAICLKKALIGIIKCYQHYASEERRRRCLCKPTCSEYAIQVLNKYGVIIGLYKIWRRLFITCRGNVYHKDEP